MSASLASAPVNSSCGSAWWRGRALWAPLLVVLANLAFLIAWPAMTQQILRNVAAAWTWRDLLHQWHDGWTLSCLPLLAMWLCFSVDRIFIRFPFVMAAVAGGTLLVLCQWAGFWSIDFFRTYCLPKWPYLCLAAIQLIAAVHLVFYPLRLLMGWRLEFSSAPFTGQPVQRFQFALRDLVWLTVATAVALAAIRAANIALSRAGKDDLLFMPTFPRLMSFGQILIPTLACAWLILGRQRQWIGALVLALALACPAIIIYSGWYVPLSLGVRELWWAHWMNVGAVACVAINLLVLRVCSLRGAVVPAQARMLSATNCPTADKTLTITSDTPAQ